MCPSEAEKAAQAVADQRRVIEAAQANTSKESLVREFGEQGLRENADGSWEYRLPRGSDGKVSQRTLRRADEMDTARQRAEERAAESARALGSSVTLRDGHGNKHEVPERMAEAFDRAAFEQRRRGRR